MPTTGDSPAMRRIMACMAQGEAMSLAEIAALAFVSEKTLSGGGYIKQLKAERRIYVAGWRKTHNGFTIALFRVGSKKDVPRSTFTAVDRDSAGLTRIVKVLEQVDEMADREAAEAAGLSVNTVRNCRYMEVLRQQERIHIVAWRRNGSGRLMAVYGAGKGKDVPRPAPLTPAQKSQQFRRRQGVLARRPTLDQVASMQTIY